MTDRNERPPMTAEQARANHPSRTGSPGASAANLDDGEWQLIDVGPGGVSDELVEILGALISGHDHGDHDHGHDTAHDYDRPELAAVRARRLAPPGADLTYEFMTDMALGSPSDPNIEPGLRLVYDATRVEYDQAHEQARRLTVDRPDVTPARIVTDISMMIEQGTGTDAEMWAPIAAHALYELIRREQAEPGDGETSGRRADRRRLVDTIVSYGAAMAAGQISRAARLWTEITAGLDR